MLTNVFRLGGLRQISWFQFVATDEDVMSPPEKRPVVHIASNVLSAHIKLQSEGHLSSWTSDTSGLLHKGSIVKLWLFIPGRNETINATIQSAVAGLKITDSGLWCYPKVPNEVSYALCEALRNRLERGFKSVGYMRFGETFVKCKSFSTNEQQLRRPLPACEVTFTVSEEAIFVHFILQKKRVRSLCIDDIQMSLKLRHEKSNGDLNAQGVLVAPNGLNGKLSGCYSSQLIHVLYESKKKAIREQLEETLAISSTYPHCITSSCGLHAEIRFGQNTCGYSMDINSGKNTVKMVSEKNDSIDRKSDYHISCTLFYSPDAVLIPLFPAVPSKVFLKRCWLQSWAGTSWMEDEVHSGSKVNKHVSRYKIGDGNLDSIHQSTDISYGIRSPSNKSSSSNTSSSGSSSLGNSSSHGSSTSNSEGEAGEAPGELEADAESLALKGKQTDPSSRQIVEDIKGFEDIADTKWVQSIGPTHNEVPVLNPLKRTLSPGGEISNDISRFHQNKLDSHVSGMVNVGIGIPKAASSQVGTPWDWSEDDRALNIENDADILAEFGDFGDFFEDEFGEPPGTAESQALMFPLTDCLDGIISPGNGCLDFTDPMLLPILDIPTLEGLERPSALKDVEIFEVPSSNPEVHECVKTPDVLPETQSPMLDSLPKSEAMLLLAPGYEPVLLPNGHTRQQSIFKSVYVPDSKKLQSDGRNLDIYVYGATPPLSPKMPSVQRKREHYNVLERAAFSIKKMKSNDSLLSYLTEKSSPALELSGLVVKSVADKPQVLGRNSAVLDNAWSNSSAYWTERSHADARKRLFSTTMLATLMDCFLVQFSFLQVRNSIMASTKEAHLNSVCTSDSTKLGIKGVLINQQEKRKKDHIPSRIAGDVDEDTQDASRLSNVGVGVWRPVGTPKPQIIPSWNETIDNTATINQDSLANTRPNLKQNHWQELLDLLPLLIQQASVPFDAAFDGDCGAGPYGWLTCKEQERRKSVCGPDAIHAGCGGKLTASHFLDNAGIELIDPLADEISAASAATMLQSDMRVAMATAFGDAYLDGPLSLSEWLKGRAFINESFGTDNAPSDSKDTVSTVIAGVGEPITPPQCATGSSCMKVSGQDIDSQPSESGNRRASSWAMEGSSLSDDGCNRRGTQEMGSVETDAQVNSYRNGPTIMAFPMPSLLVGYQDDWLKVSSSTLHLWEKAPFEPYATSKPVTYYVLCPQIESLLSATADYLQQLGCVYETCRLGTHIAANMVFAHGSFPSISTKHTFSGFVPVDFPSQASLPHRKSNSLCPSSDYVSSFSKIWNCLDFHKAVSKACKSLPVSLGSTTQREPENGSCLVYYIICPSSDPDVVLQTILVACQSIGHSITVSEKQKKLNISSQKQRGSALPDDYASIQSQGVIGFSTSKLVLQVLTAETILKLTNPGSVHIDSLKEVAFSVYNKIRRIPRLCNNTELSVLNNQSGRNRPLSLQASTAISGMWKDSGTGRSSGPTNVLPLHESLLDSSSFRPNTWDGPWQQQGISNEISILDNSKFLQESLRYLFEPVFILAEPGSLDCGAGFSPSRPAGFDESSVNIHPGSTEAVHGMVADSGFDDLKSGSLKVANLHCCYGWTEDWQWLLSVWTDARGELFDVHLFPVSSGSGVGGRFEAKGLQDLFVQVLLHGCQLMTMATSTGSGKLRAMVITRIGPFFELECQEWQKAVFIVGGSEVRKWPVQIWQQFDNSSMGGSNNSLQPQDMSTISDRNMVLNTGMPPSPGRSASGFMSRNKPSTFTKNDLGSSALRKQSLGQNDVPRGIFQFVHSVSFVSVMLDHSLQLVGFSDTMPHSSCVLGGSQGVPSASWLNSSSANVLGTLGSGIGSVRTLSSTAVSYMFVPAHGLRFMSSFPLQLPTCLTLESPDIEQLLHRSGLATVLTSAFVISRTIPSIRTESMHCRSSDEWPSTLFVGLFGHMSSLVAPLVQQHTGANSSAGTDPMLKVKLNKSLSSEGSFDQVSDAQSMVEVIAAELQALSWLTVSPTYPFRRSALPFHCEVAQRLRRLLQYASANTGNLQYFKEQP